MVIRGNPIGAILGLAALMAGTADPITTRLSYRDPEPRRPPPEPRDIEHTYTPKPLTKRQRRRLKGKRRG